MSLVQFVGKGLTQAADMAAKSASAEMEAKIGK